MRPTPRWSAGSLSASGALLVVSLFLSACSASGNSDPAAAPAGPPPEASSVQPVVRDDAAQLPPAAFAPDLRLDDVTELADSGPDLGSGEQFALSAMQLMMDSKNSGLEPEELDQIVSGDEAKRFMLHANASVEAADIEQEFLVTEPGWVRSQWIDESQGSARSEFFVRQRFEISDVVSEYWADARVDLEWVEDRWLVADFLVAAGPFEKKLDKELQEIWMQDASSWRPLSALGS